MGVRSARVEAPFSVPRPSEEANELVWEGGHWIGKRRRVSFTAAMRPAICPRMGVSSAELSPSLRPKGETRGDQRLPEAARGRLCRAGQAAIVK